MPPRPLTFNDDDWLPSSTLPPLAELDDWIEDDVDEVMRSAGIEREMLED